MDDQIVIHHDQNVRVDEIQERLENGAGALITVSYTHLTLPTKA